ncbi:HAD hydrolase-like protein [Myroides odoratimimus]|uniref:HAD family hydrolase n=1 Tax=Myroides odoratimimus TaxID=76832 RepID=UPI002DBD3E3B|nr:HAD hydrolase-like protein [Myroides odoratimimus]MEC4008530.1 HAD hydrolase-like protein [Myroides odoratimimus]
MKNNKVIVFDLDDTLVKELHFLQSAYREIACKVDIERIDLYDEMIRQYEAGCNVFEWLVSQYPNISLNTLLEMYRNHNPSVNLTKGGMELLDFCKEKGFTIGMITDGRSLTQRNKLKSLNLEYFFDLLIISEEFGSSKPSEANYKAFDRFEGQKYYIADNTKKDFISPNRLGWKSICILDDGLNIHSQNFDLDSEYLPQTIVHNLHEVIDILD